MALDDNVPLMWGQIAYCVKYGSQEVVRFSTWGQGVWDFIIDKSVSVEDLVSDNEDELKIYPIPATTHVNIAFENPSLNASRIEIHDISGKLVFTKGNIFKEVINIDTSVMSIL